MFNFNNMINCPVCDQKMELMGDLSLCSWKTVANIKIKEYHYFHLYARNGMVNEICIMYKTSDVHSKLIEVECNFINQETRIAIFDYKFKSELDYKFKSELKLHKILTTDFPELKVFKNQISKYVDLFIFS